MTSRDQTALAVLVQRQQLRHDAANRVLAEAGQTQARIEADIARLIELQARLPAAATFDQRGGFDLGAYRRTLNWLDDLATRLTAARSSAAEATQACAAARVQCAQEAERLRLLEQRLADQQAERTDARTRRQERMADANWSAERTGRVVRIPV